MRKTLVLLSLLLAAAAPAAAETISERGEAVERELVTALEGLAKWCNGRKLFGKRDEVYELLLEFAPGHAKARRTLKHERSVDGTWVQDAEYKRPRNWAPGATF